MKYYALEPEVAGCFGDNTIFVDRMARPPRVTKFHYEFDVWLGDPLLEAVGCFIVLQSLQGKILMLGATGAAFGEVEVSASEDFEELCPGCRLPKFVWLQVPGRAGKDDFGLSSQHLLVVSQPILDLFKDAGMSHCEITEFT